jgi:hypothetical protein
MKGKVIFVVILIAVLVLGLFYYLSNIRQTASNNDEATFTNVQKLISRNLDNRYPPTPKEVVTYFAELTQSLHNDEYTVMEFEALAEQLYQLYDAELQEYNPWITYIDALRDEVNEFRNSGYAISSFVVSNSTDVAYSSVDGVNTAYLHCLFTRRHGTELLSVDHHFFLRKDENGRWKVFGWDIDENNLVN